MTRLSLALLLVGSALGLKTLVLPQDFADQFGAKCLDGSPPALYMKANASSSTFVLFLEVRAAPGNLLQPAITHPATIFHTRA